MSSKTNKVCRDCNYYEFLYYESNNKALFRCNLDFSLSNKSKGNLADCIRNGKCKFKNIETINTFIVEKYRCLFGTDFSGQEKTKAYRKKAVEYFKNIN